jgi:molybdate transport system substrate-binding protein
MIKRIIILLIFGFAGAIQARTVKIVAASDLRFALDEIISIYKNQTSGANIEVTYGSSGIAYTQIANGAPFDMYFSADIVYAEKLKLAGFTLTDPKIYGLGRIVLWSASLDVSKGLDVLKEKQHFKIATANPEHAPYGQRSVEALKYYRLYERVEKQIIFGENISQAAQFCLTGNADAGLLALSLVLSPPMIKHGKYFLIDDRSHRPLEQAFVILKHAKENKLAFAFADFITTRPARSIFEKYGFTLPQKK